MLTKKNIDKLLEMPDDRMGAALKLMLTTLGLENVRMDEKSVRRLRAVLTEVTDADLERAAVLAERYRRGG